MKKLLSVIICLFLSFSMTTLLTSCTVIVSNDEFRAVEISEIKSLLPHITALEENHSINYDSGANLSMTIDTTTENEAYQTKKSQIETLSMKTIKTNGLFQTEGSNNDTVTITINEGQPSVTISNIDFYATDSVYYFILDTGDHVVRFKHNEIFTPIIKYFPI